MSPVVSAWIDRTTREGGGGGTWEASRLKTGFFARVDEDFLFEISADLTVGAGGVGSLGGTGGDFLFACLVGVSMTAFEFTKGVLWV